MTATRQRNTIYKSYRETERERARGRAVVVDKKQHFDEIEIDSCKHASQNWGFAFAGGTAIAHLLHGTKFETTTWIGVCGLFRLEQQRQQQVVMHHVWMCWCCCCRCSAWREMQSRFAAQFYSSCFFWHLNGSALSSGYAEHTYVTQTPNCWFSNLKIWFGFFLHQLLSMQNTMCSGKRRRDRESAFSQFRFRG